MASTLTVLTDYVRDELGPDLGLSTVISDADITRYINDGLARLEYHLEKVATLTWAANDASVALPVDFVSEDRLVPQEGYNLPYEMRYFAGAIYFQVGGATSGGSATLFYYGDQVPLASGSDTTDLPATGDAALVAYACYRAYKRFSSSRADYRRYSTIVQANGVDISELAAIGDQYYAEFLEGKDNLPRRGATTYYND